MATTATISVEGFSLAILYKHWDGYPESTLEWLEWFNAEFIKNRGVDPEYKFAQLIRSSAVDAERWHLDDSRWTGWGVVKPSAENSSNYHYRLLNSGVVIVKRNNS